MAPTDDSGIEPMEVWNGVLQDVREVTLRDSVVVVTHRIAATSPTAVRFQIVDPLPAEFDHEEIGFHPNFEPEHGRVSTDQAVLTGVAEPEEELHIKYGFEPQRRFEPEDVQRLQQRAKPSIEMSTKVEDAEAEEVDLESAAMTRSSSEATVSTTESDEPFSDIRRRIEEKEETAWGDESGGDERPVDEPGADSPSTGEEVEAADGIGTEEEPKAVDDLFGDAGPDERAESSEHTVAERERSGESLDDSALEASDDVSEASLEEGVAETGDVEAVSASEPDGGDHRSVVQALIDQLEADNLTDEQRRQLAEQLGSVLETGDSGRQSTEVRLGHLESQMQRFEAYADALEAVIDVHGPAEEFLSEVRDDIAALEASVDDLTRDLDDASEARSAQRRRLNELADELTTHDSRLERIRDRLESLRSDHRRETANLDERLTEIEPVAEQLDDLETEVATLQGTVERLEDRLKAVGDALSSTDIE